MDEQDPRLTRDTRTSGRGEEGWTATDPEYSIGAATAEPPDVRTREIRAEIEQTRDDMSETVNAIQDRLRPSTIASQAADSVKEAAMDKARDIADSDSVMYARANPVATAMVGIGVAGVAWLALAGRDRSPAARSYARTAGGSSRDWRNLGSPARHESYPAETYASQGEEYGRAYARPFSRSNRSPEIGTGFGQQQMARTWNQSPLLVGAGCAVLGAIVGLAVPETERENRLMGETRDDVVDTVQETVREKVTEVQQAASNAVGTVQDAAKRAVGLASDSTGQESGSRHGA
jgi:hypothetical protein